MKRQPQRRADAVTELDGGWFGATGSDDPKAQPKRLFRTKEEATIADALFIAASQPAKQPKK